MKADRQSVRGRLITISRFLLMPLVSILFIGYATCIRNLITYRNYVEIMRIVGWCAIAFSIMIIVLSSSDERRNWLKDNVLVLLYLFTRFVSLAITGFDKSVWNSIQLEMFYLLAITGDATGGFRDNRIQHIIFLAGSAFYHTLNLIIYIGFSRLPEYLQQGLQSFSEYNEYPSAAISSNPNAGGILCALGILISFILLLEAKERKGKIVYGLLAVFHIICMIELYPLVRSAELSLGVTFILLGIGLCFKKVKGRFAVVTVLGIIIAGVIVSAIWFSVRKQDNPLSLNDSEWKLYFYSTSRYLVWKTCFETMDDAPFLGYGSLKRSKNARIEYTNTTPSDRSDLYQPAASVNPHNAYFAQLAVTGWIGFILIMVHLVKKVLETPSLDKGFWYLLIICILLNNLLEELFILDRFFPCLLLFMLLEEPDIKVTN